MGRKPKKDPNAPTMIPEDVFLRVQRLQILKSAPKAPKGELTAEEWCIPPAYHSYPELKTAVHYWQQMAIVHYTERDLQVPSRMRVIEDDELSAKKPQKRKEVQDLHKYCKGQLKQATKRTGQFLKQLTKKETKELKRTNLLKQIADVDKQMNEELHNSRKFAERQELFNKEYMWGSKLGKTAPRKNALILVETSDKQAQWIVEVKDEITKFINGVIAEQECETFNIATFNSQGTVTQWQQQFQPKTDPKKGLADSLKWLNKNFSPKTCNQAWPPDWQAALNKFTAEGQQPPYHVYICCSRSPEGTTGEVMGLVKDIRENMGEGPAKGVPPLPINIVAFDPTIVGDGTEKAFFDEIIGDKGSFMIDTSAEDLLALDKMLKAVQVKKKQCDKLNKKLDKMADLSELVNQDRELFQTQAALMNMLQNDFDVFTWALNNETQAPPPEI